MLRCNLMGRRGLPKVFFTLHNFLQSGNSFFALMRSLHSVRFFSLFIPRWQPYMVPSQNALAPLTFPLDLIFFLWCILNIMELRANPLTEFKEIRKEWKARKKEEENARKADEERQRQAAAAAAQNGAPDGQGPDGPATSTYPGSRPVTLPPIGYQPNQYSGPPSAGVPPQLSDYPNHMYSNYPPPHSPYGQPTQGMYGQCKLPFLFT